MVTRCSGLIMSGSTRAAADIVQAGLGQLPPASSLGERNLDPFFHRAADPRRVEKLGPREREGRGVLGAGELEGHGVDVEAHGQLPPDLDAGHPHHLGRDDVHGIGEFGRDCFVSLAGLVSNLLFGGAELALHIWGGYQPVGTVWASSHATAAAWSIRCSANARANSTSSCCSDSRRSPSPSNHQPIAY